MKKFRDAVADNPELKNNPSLGSLRKDAPEGAHDVLQAALRNRLQADHDTRPESLSRLAQANFDLGILTEEIGDKQDALVAYRESLAIRRKLADTNPKTPQFLDDLASGHFHAAPC